MEQTKNYKSALTFAIVISLAFFILPFVSADGGYFPHPGYYVSPGQQQAVIFHENNIETMIVTSNFRGNAKDLVWILPTPSKPEVSKADEDVFNNVRKLVNPSYGGGFGYGAMIEAASTKADAGVLVIESKQVDYYDVNVLLATSSQDLVDWFNENGYSYPESYAYVLKSYIDRGWYFTAIKVSPDASGATEVVQDMKEGHPTPVKLVFLSDKIVFPLKISSVDFPSESNKICGPAKDEPTGATRKDKNGNTWTKQSDGMWSSNGTYPSMGNGEPVNLSFINTRWGDDVIDEQPCGINYGSYDNYRYSSYIPVYLYVIADSKYETDGNFYVQYGNWITKKQIENLGDDENGDAYIQPKDDNYYLTYITANLQKSEMDDDLILEKSENNQKVNAGPESWQLFLYGLLIGIIVLISWVFTPLGMLFIAGALILYFSSNKTARIFGRIMEIISLVVSFVLALIFFIIAAGNGALGHYAVLGVLGSSVLILAASVLVVIFELKSRK